MYMHEQIQTLQHKKTINKFLKKRRTKTGTNNAQQSWNKLSSANNVVYAVVHVHFILRLPHETVYYKIVRQIHNAEYEVGKDVPIDYLKEPAVLVAQIQIAFIV